MSEKTATICVALALLLLGLLGCAWGKAVLPDTPEAKACAKACLEDFNLCKATEQGRCKTRNNDCLKACPGATEL